MKIFAKLALLGLVAVLGFGFGLIRTLNNENAPLTLLPESQRPAKLAELPKALDAEASGSGNRYARSVTRSPDRR